MSKNFNVCYLKDKYLNLKQGKKTKTTEINKFEILLIEIASKVIQNISSSMN